MLSEVMNKEEKNREVVQAMYRYTIFISWLITFSLGFFVNEVLTNYSLCKKNKNRDAGQTINCCSQTQKTQLSEIENIRY